MFLAAVLISAATRGQILTVGSISHQCTTYLNGSGYETSSTNIGLTQSAFQQNGSNINISASLDCSIIVSGNSLTVNGNGQCSYAESGPASFDAGCYSDLSFAISSTNYYLFQAQVTGPRSGNNGSYGYLYNYGQGAYVADFAWPSTAFISGTQSGILAPGSYHFQFDNWFYAIFPNGPELISPPSASSGWRVIFTVSPIPIVSTTIRGYITDAHRGLSITGASMQIGPLSVSSDANGYYSQSNLPPATYTVIASANNYVSQTNVVTTSSAQTNVTQNFALSPLPKLDYFGIGVNWQNVDPPGSCSLRGDIGATELYYHFRSDLSSICNTGTIVSLDASATTIDNLNAIITQFGQFTNSVFTNDTVVFYVDCHAGVSGLYGIQISLASDYSSYPVFDALTIAGMLDSLPATTRKVVILDTCHSGGIAEELVDSVANTAALAACSAASVAQYVCSAGSDNGISVFTSAIITNLDNGIFDLHRIAANINADAFGVYENDIGQNLNLEDTGSAVFTGLQPQIWENSGFTGSLTNSVMSVVQPAPKETRPMVVNGEFKMTLTNVPSSGSIAIEVSTNLNSWLQVAFNTAAGTNLNFSFSVTNAPYQFFRTIVVP